jgi:alkanesulfonate monooxygenase SsuD/methylene tetrahydromethanopterin reductase-like flavin-dependent oxidoreductase (luciferase family)
MRLNLEIIGAYQEGLIQAGLANEAREVMSYFPVYVAESMAQARTDAEPCWHTWQAITDAQRVAPGPPPFSYDVMVDTGRALFGDPEHCRQHLKHTLEETGLDRVALLFHFGGLAQERVLASMRLFAQEVAPSFRD